MGKTFFSFFPPLLFDADAGRRRILGAFEGWNGPEGLVARVGSRVAAAKVPSFHECLKGFFGSVEGIASVNGRPCRII